RLLLGAGTVTIDGVAGGDHSVVLSGAAGNCTVGGGNPRVLHVITGGAARDTARTLFQVTCVAVTRSIEVKAATTGVDFTPDGYTVLLDNGQQRPLGDNGTTVIEGVSAGDHSVILFGAVGNCALAGNNPRTVHVTTGGSTRDTVRTTFQLTCVRVEKIAFQSGASVDQAIIAVAYADGSNTVTLARGTGPAWSPDGTRLAFTCEVDSGNSDICVINANGTGFTRLTSDPGQDAGPAWKPDGSRIAFATTRYAGAYELASMTPDGGDVTRLSPA